MNSCSKWELNMVFEFSSDVSLAKVHGSSGKVVDN